MIPLIHVTPGGGLTELWVPDETQAAILLADPAYQRAGAAPPPAVPAGADLLAAPDAPTSEDLVTES